MAGDGVGRVQTEDDKKTDFVRMASDADFSKTLGVQIIQGRDIDIYKYLTDSTAMLLNQSAVKIMRLKNPVGAIVNADGRQWHVVGVVKDFIYESPYEKVQQLAIFGPNSWFTTIHFKLNPANSTEKDLQLAETIFKKYNPQYPVTIQFRRRIVCAKIPGRKTYRNISSFVCRFNHLYFMFGFIRFGNIYGGESYKRNWCTQSTGRICNEYYRPAIERFFKACSYLTCCCNTYRMVGNVHMVKDVYLSHNC